MFGELGLLLLSESVQTTCGSLKNERVYRQKWSNSPLQCVLSYRRYCLIN